MSGSRGARSLRGSRGLQNNLAKKEADGVLRKRAAWTKRGDEQRTRMGTETFSTVNIYPESPDRAKEEFIRKTPHEILKGPDWKRPRKWMRRIVSHTPP